jgi:hypothetical protein
MNIDNDVVAQCEIYNFPALVNFMLDKQDAKKAIDLLEAGLDYLVSKSWIMESLTAQQILDRLQTLGTVLKADSSAQETHILGNNFLLDVRINHLIRYKELHIRLRVNRADADTVEQQFHDLFKDKIVENADWVKVDVDWYFKSRDTVDCRRVSEIFDDVVHPEAYPMLQMPKFIYEYFESDSSLLILMGIPGTGKTRFIRHLIQHYGHRKREMGNEGESADLARGLGASGFEYHSPQVLYTTDEEAMGDEGLFISFRCGEYDFMVLEDIDAHLVSRKSGNKLMHKFLACSDGFLASKKKIILSTNLNITDMDPALVRTGRCYACVTLNKLNHADAKTLYARLTNKPYDGWKEGEAYTVADVYNFAFHTSDLAYSPTQAVGFGAKA